MIPRIRSHHLLLEVVLRVEEECLVFLLLGALDRIELLVQYQYIFFQEYVVNPCSKAQRKRNNNAELSIADGTAKLSGGVNL